MKPSVVRVSSLLVLILLFWAAMGCAAEEQTCFQLYDRENERVLLEVPVQPGDVLRLEIEHSFEHIPWFEYYTVTEDGAFLLDTIAVGGYGAGIPAEMDVPTYVGEDGLVHMDEINSVFPSFHWITSQVNMKELLLNGQPILEFSQIPHHSFVTCEIITQRRLFHFG